MSNSTQMRLSAKQVQQWHLQAVMRHEGCLPQCEYIAEQAAAWAMEQACEMIDNTIAGLDSRQHKREILALIIQHDAIRASITPEPKK